MRANGSSPCCHLRGMWTPGPDAPSETGLKWHHAIVPGVVSRLAGGGAALRPSPSDSLDHDICIPQWFCSLQRRRHAARFDSSVIRLCGMRHARTHTHRARIRRCSSGPSVVEPTSQSLHTHAGRLCSLACDLLAPRLKLPGVPPPRHGLGEDRVRHTDLQRIRGRIPTSASNSVVRTCTGPTLNWTLSVSTGPSGSRLGVFSMGKGSLREESR